MYMWEMAQVFQKRLKYVGNDVDLWEMAQICGEMTQLFDKRLKNVGNDLVIWEMAKYLGNGLDTWGTA